MKPACPAPDRLKLLIKEAFNELPDPDPARIQRIASTLERQCPTTGRPQQKWLFWLLLGGSMTAMAWWGANKQDVTQEPTSMKQTIPQLQSGTTATSPTDTSEIHVEKQPAPHQSQHRSPVIDQRELY